MEALRTQSFYLKAIIPGCGNEPCEVSEDMWADLVLILQSALVVPDIRQSGVCNLLISIAKLTRARQKVQSSMRPVLLRQEYPLQRHKTMSRQLLFQPLSTASMTCPGTSGHM